PRKGVLHAPTSGHHALETPAMRMRLPFSSSTQIRIGLTFGILALVTFAAVAAISGASARQQVMADAGASLGELATRLSATLDAGMFERYREIQNIAHLE